MNHYVLLGVPQNADAGTIRSAFRALARQYHPDAGEGSSTERFRQILAAYETLSDPTRRRHYDRRLPRRGPTSVRTVEPLTAHVAPEPLLSRGRGVVRTHPLRGSHVPARLHELIDGFFQAWDEALSGRRL